MRTHLTLKSFPFAFNTPHSFHSGTCTVTIYLGEELPRFSEIMLNGDEPGDAPRMLLSRTLDFNVLAGLIQRYCLDEIMGRVEMRRAA